MVSVPTWINGCDSQSPDARICFTVAFPPLGNSDHVIVSVSIGFPSHSKGNVTFHRTAYEYCRADCNGFWNHLRDIPWEDIFKI